MVSIDDGSGPRVPEVSTAPTTPPRMEGNHLMMEEGMEGENVSMKEEEDSSCTKEADGHMKEDDTFEDTCNTTSSFSPSPAVSRRITMGVRGIRALEEWCRRAVQVRRHIQKCQTDIPVFSKKPCICIITTNIYRPIVKTGLPWSPCGGHEQLLERWSSILRSHS